MLIILKSPKALRAAQNALVGLIRARCLKPLIQENLTAKNLRRRLILRLVVVFNLELRPSEGYEPFLGGVASIYFPYTAAHGRNFVVKCGGSV